jgi:hypothetical protein
MSLLTGPVSEPQRCNYPQDSTQLSSGVFIPYSVSVTPYPRTVHNPVDEPGRRAAPGRVDARNAGQQVLRN